MSDLNSKLMERKQELSGLQKEHESLANQIRGEYEKRMREFENAYPLLKIVDKIRFTTNELQDFLRLQKNR